MEEACQKAESEHGTTREALALAGEACRKAEEESDRLADERLSLVMELGTVKDEFAAFREKAAAEEKQWRPSSILVATHCSMTAMVVAFSCTTFAGAGLISLMECRIPQSRSPQNSSPIPDAPQASCQPLQPRNQLRSVRRLGRLLQEKRRFFRWIPRQKRIPLLSSVKCSIEIEPGLISVLYTEQFSFFFFFY